MDLRLTATDLELKQKARAFTEQHLFPYELECEESNGLPAATIDAIKKAALENELNAINHAPEDGGRGLDLFQQVLVQEELGKATGALWDVVWRPSIPLKWCTEAQKDEYLRPACRGDRRDCYAITEEAAGSDASGIVTTAVRDGDGYVITGEKWYVTVGDVADFILVHAHVDGDAGKPTVFIVDKDLPGVKVVRTPRYMHTFVFEHPIFSFTGVRVGADKVLGTIGQGYELTKDWFVEERLMIGARTVGASVRALELSTGFAGERLAFGRPLAEHQGVGFMLADMAAEIMAAKSLLYRVAGEAARGGLSRGELHAQAAAVKLVCSETAGRVIDKAVQIYGGRGYMREQPVERLWRELRVDRIWEGTSEIQRVIIDRELRKRGPGVYTEWPF
ncbi:MAG: acyl-CoA/acyl-ACP dehydrogenase [Actinomycetota bacterium]|nr:acyl-CoA/acyl-ACP dehydrogenase [Actinomycetota bacterium]